MWQGLEPLILLKSLSLPVIVTCFPNLGVFIFISKFVAWCYQNLPFCFYQQKKVSLGTCCSAPRLTPQRPPWSNPAYHEGLVCWKINLSLIGLLFVSKLFHRWKEYAATFGISFIRTTKKRLLTVNRRCVSLGPFLQIEKTFISPHVVAWLINPCKPSINKRNR